MFHFAGKIAFLRSKQLHFLPTFFCYKWLAHHTIFMRSYQVRMSGHAKFKFTQLFSCKIALLRIEKPLDLQKYGNQSFFKAEHIYFMKTYKQALERSIRIKCKIPQLTVVICVMKFRIVMPVARCILHTICCIFKAFFENFQFNLKKLGLRKRKVRTLRTIPHTKLSRQEIWSTRGARYITDFDGRLIF